MIRSNINLIKIAALGGIATVTMGMAYQWKLNENIRNTDFYKEALQTLRSHKPALQLLGEPIKAGSINVEDVEKNYAREREARYEVPVKGPKEKGMMYLWARKEGDSDQWVVKRIELQLKKDASRRLVVRKDAEQTDVLSER